MTAQEPQYALDVIVNGTAIDSGKPLDDPFVTTTLTVGREDLLAALESTGDLVVTFRIHGTRAAYRHVMGRPMDLTPNDEQPTPIADAAYSASPQE